MTHTDDPLTGPGQRTFNPLSINLNDTPAPPPAPKAAPSAPVAPEPVALKKTTPTLAPTPVPAKDPACACAATAPAVPALPAATTPAKATLPEEKVTARRRATVKIALVVLAIAAMALWLRPWESVEGLTASNNPAPAVIEGDQAANTDQISADLVYAEDYLTTNGSLNGITIDGAQVAVRDSTMYAVRTLNGVCTVYGLLNGQRLIPAPDATGAACTGQIVTVQAQLDAAAAQVQSTAETTAEATLRDAAQAALAYSSRNFVNDTPSLTGLPATLSGATVTANTGDYATLRVSYPGACLEAFVTAAGEVGDINTCT